MYLYYYINFGDRLIKLGSVLTLYIYTHIKKSPVVRRFHLTKKN